MNLLNQISNLIRNRKNNKGYFKKMLGSDAFHFWKDVGKNGDFIEQIRFLQQLPEIRKKCKNDDFLYWIIRGCIAEDSINKKNNKIEKEESKNKLAEKKLEEKAQKMAEDMS